MSKRKRLSVKRAKTKQTAEEETNLPVQNKSNIRRNRWRRLSLQTRLLTVLAIGLLTLGAFGAGWKYLDENAKENISAGSDSTPLNSAPENLLSKINPFVPAASPSPTPQLSKEYIYAGGRLLAVEDANANAAPPSDLAVWRPSTGVWWVMGGQGSQQVAAQWGQTNDVPVPGDYDGDGKTDFAIFRPDATGHVGNWYLLYSATNSWNLIQWGLDTDAANLTPADFDGDGKTDIALWRPSNGGWYVLKSSDNQALSFQFGSSGDKPAPADYDGDGKADVALWRGSNQTFYSINSSNQASQTIAFSQTSTEPVSADYDGDGKADFAIRSGANWIIRNSSNGAIQSPISWQSAGDKAVHNDYDGDGKVDVAVWRASNGTWYIRNSLNPSQPRVVQWGVTDDIPVPAFYRR